VGLVVGSQFAASLISRLWRVSIPTAGARRYAVVIGLLIAAAAGLLYLLSLQFVSQPEMSVTILLLGRALLGAGESFIITGAQSWGLTLAGPQNTGKVLAWMGTAMYAALRSALPRARPYTRAMASSRSRSRRCCCRSPSCRWSRAFAASRRPRVYVLS